MKRLIEGRFRRLKLKDQPIESTDPASNDDIDLMKRHLRDLFPGIDLTKLLKSTTRKNTPYQDWIKSIAKRLSMLFKSENVIIDCAVLSQVFLQSSFSGSRIR